MKHEVLDKKIEVGETDITFESIYNKPFIPQDYIEDICEQSNTPYVSMNVISRRSQRLWIRGLPVFLRSCGKGAGRVWAGAWESLYGLSMHLSISCQRLFHGGVTGYPRIHGLLFIIIKA